MKKILAGIFFLFLSVNIYAQCIDSTQIQYGAYCDPRWEPVCACNGVTYRNDCFARNAGITTWNYGICDAVDFDFIPNPPQDYINMDVILYTPGVVYVQVIDRFGKMYYTNGFSGSDRYRFQIDCSYYPIGIYFVYVFTDNGFRVKKLAITDTN
ncbi:MAG: hypothetical protein Fur0041_11360 [Bacteroidia bacterium]